MELGARLPEFSSQFTTIEKNIKKGQEYIENAHKGRKNKYSQDPTENRKMRV